MTQTASDRPARQRPRADDGMSRLQRLTYRVWLAVGVVLLLAVTLALLYRPLAVIIAPLLLALLIVYLLDPVVSVLHRRGVPRLLGTLAAYLVVLGALAGGGLALAPAVGAQVQELAADAPALGDELVTRTERVADELGMDVDPDTLQVPALAERAQQFVAEAENRELTIAVLGGLSGLARGALFVLVALLLGPVIAFYALVDLPNLRRTARNLLPPRHRDEARELAAKLGRVVGGFVRGQLVIALAIGVTTSVALAIVGLPYWLLVGVVAGVANVVPLLGPLVAGALGALIALVTSGFGFAVLVVAVMTAVQQLDGQLMSPLIFGRTVRVHPLAVLLGLLVAGSLYGVFGMLVAVPLIAGAKVVVQHVWHTRVPWAGAAGGAAGEPGEPAADEAHHGAAAPPRAPAPEGGDGAAGAAAPAGPGDGEPAAAAGGRGDDPPGDDLTGGERAAARR